MVVKGEADVENAKVHMALYLAARDALEVVLRLLSSIRPLERM